MDTRRQAFVLAAALTATIFTAAAALAGISHKAPARQPVATPVAHVAPQTPAPPPQWEEDD